MNSLQPGDTSFWRGNIDDLQVSLPDRLLKAPIFVVEHEPYRKYFHERQAVVRNREVGMILARMLGGEYWLETRGYNFKSAAMEHIDGVVDNFLQVHTAFLLDKTLRQTTAIRATRFTMRTYCFSDEQNIHTFIEESDSQKLPTEYANSILIQDIYNNSTDSSLSKQMRRKGFRLPEAASEFAVDVPIGSTAVFVNGFGFGNEILSHETQSVNGDGRPVSFRRIASLGRVVAPQAISLALHR